jgi:hypothetical protein
MKKPSNDIAIVSRYFVNYHKKRMQSIHESTKTIEQLVAHYPKMTGQDVIRSISWGRIKELTQGDPKTCGVCESELEFIPIKEGLNIRCSNDDCETGIETVKKEDIE